jgi:hypothetical protein
VLISEIKDDLSKIESLVREIQQGVDNIQESQPPNPIEMRGWALLIHDYYTAVESIFTRIAANINGGYPGGADSHQRLLRNMTLNVEGLRPPVITRQLLDEFDELRKFRHFLRHAYGVSLEWTRIRSYMVRVAQIAPRFEAAMSQFIGFLEALAERL